MRIIAASQLDCIRNQSEPEMSQSEHETAVAEFTAPGRERSAVSAILANRRIAAATKVVVFSRWLTGTGVKLHGE